jgi:hypothetical protein
MHNFGYSEEGRSIGRRRTAVAAHSGLLRQHAAALTGAVALSLVITVATLGMRA